MGSPQGLHSSFIRYFRDSICPKFGVDITKATTKDVCNQVILPLTKEKQCTLIDLLPVLRAEAEAEGFITSTEPSWQSAATVFISHAWKYPLSAPIGVMLQYAELEDAGTYFWFDLFINNQNGFEVTHSFEWLCGRFKDSIRAIGKVILVLSPWNDPIPLTRSWCLWELVSTAELDTQVEFVVRLPSGEQEKFTEAIKENAGVVYQSLLDVDARRAEASVDSDRVMISEAIEKTVGYASVNAMVKDQMSSWIISVVRSLLRTMEEQGKQDEFEYGELAFQANLILSVVSSDTAERLSLMEAALRALSKEYASTHPFIVSCHQSLGDIYIDLDRLDEAEASLTTALEQTRESTECQPLTESTIMASFARLYHRLSDYNKLIACQTRGLEVVIQELGENHPQTAEAKMNLAVAYHEQGKFEQALELLLSAEGVMLQDFGASHPSTNLTQDNIAWSLFELGRAEEALRYADKALEGRRSALGNHHTDTAFSRITRSQALVALNRFQEAIEELSRAEPDANESFNQGFLYHVWGQAALGLDQPMLARTQFEKALHYRQEAGSKADEAGRTLIGLSRACNALEDGEAAARFASQAVETLSSGLGSDHSDTRKAVSWQEELANTGTLNAGLEPAINSSPVPTDRDGCGACHVV
eukprot:m.7291 g.7291  ORF g.7291 m.7291 type:complete len:647 (+) comp8788_c0_seq1:78-2018(+)